MTKARLENLIPHVNVRKRSEITRHCWRRVSGKVLCLDDRAGSLRDMRRRSHHNPELLTERDMSDQCARRPTTSLGLALLVSRGPGLAAQPGRNRGTARPPFHADRRELAGRRSGMVLRPRQIRNPVLEDEAPRRL